MTLWFGGNDFSNEKIARTTRSYTHLVLANPCRWMDPFFVRISMRTEPVRRSRTKKSAYFAVMPASYALGTLVTRALVTCRVMKQQSSNRAGIATQHTLNLTLEQRIRGAIKVIGLNQTSTNLLFDSVPQPESNSYNYRFCFTLDVSFLSSF